MDNLPCLFKIFERISECFKKYSDIRIEILNNRHIYFLKGYYEYCQKYVHFYNININCLKFSILDELSCFLIPKTQYENDLKCISIFEMLKDAKELYDNSIKFHKPTDSITYSLATSEASNILRGIGIPCCLEEIIVKMDLMGI